MLKDLVNKDHAADADPGDDVHADHASLPRIARANLSPTDRAEAEAFDARVVRCAGQVLRLRLADGGDKEFRL